MRLLKSTSARSEQSVHPSGNCSHSVQRPPGGHGRTSKADLALPCRRQLRRTRLALKNHLQWPLGVVPVPGQRLRTVIIGEDGARRTIGQETAPDGRTPIERVMVVGGSVAYGYGATGDEATIPGRLQHWLNSLEPRRPDIRWEVANYAFPGATSFQELISVLQRSGPGRGQDYVVSLTGWNDVDDQFAGAVPNVSGLAELRAPDREAEHGRRYGPSTGKAVSGREHRPAVCPGLSSLAGRCPRRGPLARAKAP
jgi:hypothetical protein